MRAVAIFVGLATGLGYCVATTPAPADEKETMTTAEQAKRIAAFLADPEAKESHDFPAWNRYREIVGDGPVARRVFTEILHSEPELFTAIGDEQKLRRIFASRLTEIKQRAYSGRRVGQKDARSTDNRIAFGSVAGLFLVAAQPEITLDSNQDDFMQRLLSQPDVIRFRPGYVDYGRNGIPVRADADPKTGVFKKLISRWAGRQGDIQLLAKRLRAAVELDMRDARISIARQFFDFMAHDKDSAKPLPGEFYESILPALISLDVLGTREDIPRAALALYDQWNRNIREQALGTVIELNGGKPEDYGLDVQVHKRSQSSESYRTYSFPNEDRRKKGIEMAAKNYKKLGLEKPPMYIAPPPPPPEPKYPFVSSPMLAKSTVRGPLANTPDGKVTLKIDGNKARLVEVATGKPIGAQLVVGKVLDVTVPFTCWSFSRDGKRVATGAGLRERVPDSGGTDNNFGRVQLWDATTGMLLAEHETGKVNSVMIADDGRTVVYQADKREIDGP